jgi:hypothetical protein
MGIDDLTAPSAEDDKPVRTTEDDPRLDYAWKWFNFHAEQRTKMFNYMLVGLGILATAIATMVQKGLALEASCLSAAGVLLCIAFWFMDYRNRYLYSLAQGVLLQIETTQLFPGESETGIVKELSQREGGPKPWRTGIAGGQHRFWMPLVIIVFAILFGSAIALAIYMGSSPDLQTSPDKAVFINEAFSPRNGDDPLEPSKDSLALFETVRFGGFAEGIDSFDCKTSSNAARVETISNAIKRAQTQRLQPILFLIGGTDRAALSPVLRSRFESNSGLARARVAAVERCLALSGEPDGATPTVVLRLVSGPSYTPKSSGAQDAAANALQAQDREVQAFVIGMRANRSSSVKDPSSFVLALIWTVLQRISLRACGQSQQNG